MLERPPIPVIVGDTPHLCVLRHFGRVFQLRRSRRQAQHNRPPRLLDRLGNLPYLRRPVRMVADAVHLDEVQPPAGIELQHRIVVSLPRRVVLDAPVALIPRARRIHVGRVCCMKCGPSNGHVVLHRLARNPAHNMDAELQPLRMNPVRQRLESRPARRRRKPSLDRNQYSVTIQQILPRRHVRAEGIGHVPTLVDHRIRPPVLLQPCKYRDIGLEVGLIDR